MGAAREASLFDHTQSLISINSTFINKKTIKNNINSIIYNSYTTILSLKSKKKKKIIFFKKKACTMGLSYKFFFCEIILSEMPVFFVSLDESS